MLGGFWALVRGGGLPVVSASGRLKSLYGTLTGEFRKGLSELGEVSAENNFALSFDGVRGVISVNFPSGPVVTAMGKNYAEGAVFTKLDSAVIA